LKMGRSEAQIKEEIQQEKETMKAAEQKIRKLENELSSIVGEDHLNGEEADLREKLQREEQTVEECEKEMIRLVEMRDDRLKSQREWLKKEELKLTNLIKNLQLKNKPLEKKMESMKEILQQLRKDEIMYEEKLKLQDEGENVSDSSNNDTDDDSNDDIDADEEEEKGWWCFGIGKKLDKVRLKMEDLADKLETMEDRMEDQMDSSEVEQQQNYVERIKGSCWGIQENHEKWTEEEEAKKVKAQLRVYQIREQLVKLGRT